MVVEIDIVLETYEELRADGQLYVWDDGRIHYQFPICSGGYGKGWLEIGSYSIRGLISPEKIAKLPGATAYQTDGYGWAAPLSPLFDSHRTGIWLHMDGNVPGSLGCVVWKQPLEFNKQLYSYLKEILRIQPSIPVSVRKTWIE